MDYSSLSASLISTNKKSFRSNKASGSEAQWGEEMHKSKLKTKV
jgi:hypothetical protein